MILDYLFGNSEGKEYTYGEAISNFSWQGLHRTNLTREDYLKEMTYLKCLSFPADKVASLGFTIKYHDEEKGDRIAYEHPYSTRLMRPNEGMNFVNMIRSLVMIGEHEGISCLYIEPKTGKLYPCRINQIYVDDIGLIKSNKSIPVAFEIVCNNETQLAAEESCIVYHGGITTDGISATSKREYMEMALKTNIKGQEILHELFNNGLTSKVLIQLMSDIQDEKELKKIQKKFNKMYSSEGRVFTVPAGYKVSPLNLSLADSQFKELKSMSRKEIASLWCLTPSMLNEDTTGTNNYEEENLRYLTDFLLVKIKALEQEFNYKYLGVENYHMGYFMEINFEALLKTTSTKQKDIIIDYAKHGVYSLEYARELIGAPKAMEGTVAFPSGQVLLKDLIEGRMSYQKKGAADPPKGGENEDE